MKKQKELSLNKRYTLPTYVIVFYENLKIVVFPDIASWILIKSSLQEKIFHSIADDRLSVQELMETYKNNQSDLVYILTQIEAKQIETLKTKSIFVNKRLHLHLTNMCNLRCSHCYMSSGFREENELTTGEVFKLIENFKNIADGNSIDITGGEPTTRKDFFQIIEFIDSLGLEINVYTNGTNWTEDDVKRFSKFKKKNVQISIDGFDEKSNSVIRGKGTFAKSLQTVDLLIKNDVYVKIAVTPTFELLKRYKSEYITFLKNIIERYGKDKININISHELMPGRELSDEQIKLFKDEYYNLAESVAKEVIDDYENSSFVVNVKDALFDSCGYGGLNVTATGDFYFCDRIPDMNGSCGNVCEMEFSEIFRLMKCAEKVGRIKNFKPCGNCEIRYICGGGCRISQFKGFSDISDVENVDFSKIEPRICNDDMKAHYYKLMVENNEKFYK